MNVNVNNKGKSAMPVGNSAANDNFFSSSINHIYTHLNNLADSCSHMAKIQDRILNLDMFDPFCREKTEHLTKIISDKTGYLTRVFVTTKPAHVNFNDGDSRDIKYFEIHISVNNGYSWKYCTVDSNDVNQAAEEFMYSLAAVPQNFKTYTLGMFGKMLETVLHDNNLEELGYDISNNKFYYTDISKNFSESKLICKTDEIINLNVAMDGDGELMLIDIVTSNKRITITGDYNMSIMNIAS